MTKKGASVEKASFYVRLVRIENREGKIGKKKQSWFFGRFFRDDSKIGQTIFDQTNQPAG
jgi:hypothetical protein